MQAHAGNSVALQDNPFHTEVSHDKDASAEGLDVRRQRGHDRVVNALPFDLRDT